MTPAAVAHVVVGIPVPRVFSYTVPAEVADGLGPGQRVRVPFRGKGRVGVVVELVAGEPDGLEPLEAVLDPVPALTAPLLALTRWAAEQTASAWGEAVARALPPSARAGAPATMAPESGLRASGGVVVGFGAGRAALVEVGRASGRGRV